MSRKSVINRPAPPRTVTGASLLTLDDSLVTADTSLSSFAVTLPDAVAFDLNIIYIKAPSAGTNPLTINCLGVQTIDGQSSIQLTLDNEFILAHSDGANWRILSREALGSGVVGVNLITSGSSTRYTTIAAALAAASSGDAVVCGPGNYAESGLVVPAGVKVESSPIFSARITGATATGTRVTLGDGSSLVGFDLEAPTDATPTVDYAGSASAFVSDCTINGNGASGIGFRGQSGRLRVFNCRYLGGTIDSFIKVEGGTLISEDCQLYDGTITSVFEIDAGTLVDAQTLQLSSSTATNGFLVNGGTVISEDARWLNVVNGLHITADNTSVTLRTPKFDSTTWNLLADPAVTAGALFVVAAQGDRTLISANPAYLATAAISFQDERPGDEAFLFFSEVSVGVPGFGRELSSGEGDSFTRGMVAFSASTPSSGFTDITSALLLPDGTTAALMPGTGVGNTFYLGSQQIPVAGMKILLSTAMNLGATGAVVVEYSNSTGGFTAFDTMSTQSDFPYAAYGSRIFERAQSEQVRYDAIQGSWATQTVNGVTAYWIRVRVTSAITTAPVADLVKLSPNRTEINADGFLEFFGRAQPVRLLNWHRRLEDDLIGASPLNEALALAVQIAITPIDNEFANGVIDGNGGIIPVPIGLDTSRPLIYRAGWTPLSNGSGDVELELRTALIKEGDILNGTIPRDLTTVVTPVSGQIDELIVNTFEFRVPEAVPGDFIALSFARDATPGNPDDTYASRIAMVFSEIEGTFWR